MTDDLVKRLRDKNCCDASNCNCDEAADSIESWKAGFQLENERWAEAQDRIEALEELLKWVLGTIGHDHPAKKAIRAALGEKKDD